MSECNHFPGQTSCDWCRTAQRPETQDVERLAEALMDNRSAIQRWLTVGWKDTMADEAVVLARTLLARLAATEEAEVKG